MQRPVRALNNFRGAIVMADSFDQLFIRFAGTFRNENVTGAAQIPRWFAQCSTRQKKFVPERRLPINQHDIEPMLEVEILQTVVEQQSIGVHFFNREEPALDAILVDQYGHVFQVVRQHVGLVSGSKRVEQQGFPIGNDAWWIGIVAAYLCQQTALARARNTFITTAKNGNVTSSFLQSTGKFFHNRSLARSTDSEIPDADNENAESPLTKNSFAIKEETELHESFVNEREKIKKRPQQSRANSAPTFENDIDRKLLEIFQRAAHSIADFKTRTPRLSARVMTVCVWNSRDALSIAAAIFFESSKARAQIADPEPLRKAPKAPARSAAVITQSKNGISFFRNG